MCPLHAVALSWLTTLSDWAMERHPATDISSHPSDRSMAKAPMMLDPARWPSAASDCWWPETTFMSTSAPAAVPGLLPVAKPAEADVLASVAAGSERAEADVLTSAAAGSEPAEADVLTSVAAGSEPAEADVLTSVAAGS